MPNISGQKRRAEESKDCDDSSKKLKTVCVFCLSSQNDEIQLGEILKKDDLTCHYFCLLLSSGLYQNAKPNEKSSLRGFLLDDIRNEVKRGFRLKCFYCQERGATLGCCAKKCKKAFHLPCSKAKGSLHQFFGGFGINPNKRKNQCKHLTQTGAKICSFLCQARDTHPSKGSYCDDHCPKQSLRECDKIENVDDLSCSICLSPLGESLSSVNVLHSPCCNNSWFHRSCIQQYAISAGKHHFKCPLCNCGKEFFSEMQHFGIYIPDQDASWERQSDAYGELLERHNTCDADVCSCPSGRNHDAETGKYNLLLCSCCGSFGSHRTCRGLVWYDSSLMCPLCAKIEKEFVEPERKARLKEDSSGSGTSRGSNSQSEASSSSTSQEKIIHLEMADESEDIDVDDDSDMHIPPFLRNSLSRKILRQAVFLPSCSLVLQKVDEIISMSDNSVNVSKIPGFTYHRRKGYLIRNKVKFKQKSKNYEIRKYCHDSSEVLENSHKIPNEREDTEEYNEKLSRRKNTYIKLFDGENDSKEQKIIKCIKRRSLRKGKRDKENKNITQKKRRLSKMVSKIHTSPLSSLKKQKALKFLLNFNQSAPRRRRGSKTPSPIMNFKKAPESDTGKRLIQSTLNFLKSSVNSPCREMTNDKYKATICNKGSLLDIKDSSAVSANDTTHVDSENKSIKTGVRKRKRGTGKKSYLRKCTTKTHNCKAGIKKDEKDNECVSPVKRRHGSEYLSKSCISDVNLSQKGGTEADGDLTQMTSVITTPCKKDAVTCENMPACTTPSKNVVMVCPNQLDSTTIATTPHKREAKANKEIDFISVTTVLSTCTPVQTTPQKKGTKIGEVSTTPSNKDAVDQRLLDGSSIAATPHKREAKATTNTEKDNLSLGTTPSKKGAGKHEGEGDTSALTSPHKRASKAERDSKAAATPCKKRLHMEQEGMNISIETMPHQISARGNEDN